MPIPSLRHTLLPMLLLTSASAALAQYPTGYPTGATVQQLPRANDPAELLAQALRTLAIEPANLAALMAAGHNALVLGDPNAAVGFFGRAQEIAPRDGRAKAGLGSALVELEKPQDALRLFDEAEKLGVPEAEFAEDRGLAYDLTGDPRRAQRDYATVLAAHPDDDLVRRRLALSQGISGDKAAAIVTLDPLIRKRDIAGWRAQTFVLAMNGDAKGASDITHIMLPQQADMLQPFLVRLATLSPADKARAVNFGEMPAAGRAYTPTELANTGAAPTYAAPTRAERHRAARAPAQTVAAAPQAVAPVQVAPTPQVATRASDLAPAPATSRVVTPSTRITMAAPVATPPASTPVPVVAKPVPSAPLQSAPLAGIALTPAPTPAPATSPVATQIVPTPKPAPVVVAQTSPSPVAVSGPPASDLAGRPAVDHQPAPPAVIAAPVAAATTQTVGTPVVHTKPVHTKIAVADASPVDQPTASRKQPVAEPPEDKTPAKAKGRHTTVASSSGETDVAAKGGKGMHGKPSSDDSDTIIDRKGHKTTHGKLADADATDDQGSAKSHKSAHGKTDDSDTASKSRKGAHGTKLAVDDSDTGSAKPRKPAHDKKASDDEDAKSSKSSKKSADKAAPERVFVQVAGGANKDDMDKAWAGLKKKAPDLMKGHTPQTTPVHATNRLLVGPFKSDEEAQAFVNKMAGKGLSGFTVKTNKGQKVEKVDSGQ